MPKIAQRKKIKPLKLKVVKGKDKIVKKSEAVKAAEPEKYIRPTWDEYFMNIVDVVRTRGTCDRGRTGCVVVRDKRILVTGYVGSPMGTKHCDEAGHEMHTVVQDDGTQSRHCIRTTHSEQNAIANAARMGIALDNAILYAHMMPCYTCAKILINAGIKRVICRVDYHATKRSKEIFDEAGIVYIILENKMQTYKDM